MAISNSAPRPSSSTRRESWLRQRALVSLTRDGIGTRWLSRAGRFSAWYTAFGHSALLLWLSSRGDSDLSGIVISGVGWVSASAGLVALAAAADLEEHLRQHGIHALAVQRGFNEVDLQLARATATISTVVRATLLPSVFLACAAVAASNTIAAGIAATLRVFAVAFYSLLFGISMGLLARWSAALSPKHPKALFAGIVLVPEAARLAVGGIPSVVAFFGQALVEIDRLAGGIG